MTYFDQIFDNKISRALKSKIVNYNQQIKIYRQNRSTVLIVRIQARKVSRFCNWVQIIQESQSQFEKMAQSGARKL